MVLWAELGQIQGWSKRQVQLQHREDFGKSELSQYWNGFPWKVVSSSSVRVFQVWSLDQGRLVRS